MRLSSRTLSLTIGLGAVLMSGASLAHHGWSWYTNGDFELTGTIVDAHFGNPHDRLTLDVDGTHWNVVLSTPDRSRRAEFVDSSVEVGDTVTAYGHRHADGDTLEMKTERLKVGDRLFDLYPRRS